MKLQEVDVWNLQIETILSDPNLDEGFKDSLRTAQKYVTTIVKKLVVGMGIEKQETKEMVKIFLKMLNKKLGRRADTATPEEVRAALAQLKDMSKVALAAFALFGPLPAGDETVLIGTELLAKRFGMSIFPSALKGIL